jgi:hypothetical protein
VHCAAEADFEEDSLGGGEGGAPQSNMVLRKRIKRIRAGMKKYNTQLDEVKRSVPRREYQREAVLRIRIRIRSHMFLGLLDPDPDPSVRCMDPDPNPSIIQQK